MHLSPRGMMGSLQKDSRAGAFSLRLAGGIRAYTEPRPALVLVTSAATERNARIGDDAEARAADIPIVQLNPQVRARGCPCQGWLGHVRRVPRPISALFAPVLLCVIGRTARCLIPRMS